MGGGGGQGVGSLERGRIRLSGGLSFYRSGWTEWKKIAEIEVEIGWGGGWASFGAGSLWMRGGRGGFRTPTIHWGGFGHTQLFRQK